MDDKVPKKENLNNSASSPDKNIDIFSKIAEGIALLIKKLTTPNDVLVNYPQANILVATPARPASPEVIANPNVIPAITGYDRVPIYYDRHRIANSAWVTNDGGDTLFVITTNDAINWSGESQIFPGESRQFLEVYELRVRSPKTCTLYRVTEYKPEGILPANLCDFTAQVVNAPVLGALLPDIVVPAGYALVIRANVLNNGQVFIANSIANATNVAIPGNRNTLNAGDAVRLFITNANLVAVAGSAAAQNVDILVEQRT